MGCESNNATPPSPAIAPGAEEIDVPRAARAIRVDPRLEAIVPGFDAPFFQAGLAGYSDAAMRIVARRQGCPLCVTEALLDRTLLAGGRGFAKADLGDIAENVPGGTEDTPLVGQIMGSDPDEMARAAVKMIEQGKRPASVYRRFSVDQMRERLPVSGDGELGFCAIDVNLACPVKKIRKKARGGHWLREPEGALDILRAVRDAVPPGIATTLKIRRGSDDSEDAERRFHAIFEGAYELGYSWATVHGRTVEQKYVGPSRWTFLRDLVRRYPDRLIFGSGDVWSAHEIIRMIEFTGVHAVSVARGCIGNPWVFRQARDLLAGRTPEAPTIEEQRAVLLDHFELSMALNGERLAGRLMRKFGVRFSTHHPDSDSVRREFTQISSFDDWRAVLDRHYNAEAAEPVTSGA